MVDSSAPGPLSPLVNAAADSSAPEPFAADKVLDVTDLGHGIGAAANFSSLDLDSRESKVSDDTDFGHGVGALANLSSLISVWNRLR